MAHLFGSFRRGLFEDLLSFAWDRKRFSSGLRKTSFLRAQFFEIASRVERKIEFFSLPIHGKGVMGL